MIKKNVFVMMSVLVLASCASIVSKSTYPISIKSTPTGANITIAKENGIEVYTGKTPATVPLKAGDGFFTKASYIVKLQMAGYEEKIIPVQYKIDGWYFGNIAFGGLVGLVVVDPATGAMWKLETEFINETLVPLSSAVTEPSIRIYTYNDVPSNWKEHLIKIN